MAKALRGFSLEKCLYPKLRRVKLSNLLMSSLYLINHYNAVLSISQRFDFD